MDDLVAPLIAIQTLYAFCEMLTSGNQQSGPRRGRSEAARIPFEVTEGSEFQMKLWICTIMPLLNMM